MDLLVILGLGGMLVLGLLLAAARDAGYKLNLDSGDDKDGKEKTDGKWSDDDLWDWPTSRPVNDQGHDWARGWRS